jgi:hypothetical protein
MKIDFTEEGIRLLPETDEENNDLASRFLVTPPFKAVKQKVSLIQAVDKYACPIKGEYYLSILKDQKQKVIRKKRGLNKDSKIPTVAQIPDDEV